MPVIDIVVSPIIDRKLGNTKFTINYDMQAETVFHEGHANRVIQLAKAKFRLPGKMFLMVVQDSVFFTTKIRKEWVSYLIKGK